MRGDDQQSDAMFSYIGPEQRVPADQPLRPIRAMVDGAPGAVPELPSCIRGSAARRSRPRNCSGACCSSSCTPFAASGS